MEKQNIEEYKLIRKEMIKLKDCMTHYIGYVLGGISIIYIGVAALTKLASSYNNYALTFSILSIIISMVLLILFYKFNSYNRYAGYCKLLNQERFDIKDEKHKDAQFMSWEVCVDKLREFDFDFDQHLKYCDEIDDENDLRDKVKKKLIEYDSLRGKRTTVGSKQDTDKSERIKKFNYGLKLLIKGLPDKAKTTSWQFPLFVVAVFLILVTIFLVTSSYFAILYFINHGFSLAKSAFLFSTLLIIVYVQLVTWVFYLRKLFDLMNGYLTVEAYSWRFLPIRNKFLKEKDNKISYKLTSLVLDE